MEGETRRWPKEMSRKRLRMDIGLNVRRRVNEKSGTGKENREGERKRRYI